MCDKGCVWQRYKLPIVFSLWCYQEVRSYSSVKFWQHTWNISSTRLGRLSAKVLWHASHTGTFFRVCTKLLDPQRKASVQHESHQLYKVFRHRGPLFSVRERWKPSPDSGFQTPTDGQPFKQDFLRIGVLGLLYEMFLHSSITLTEFFALNQNFYF